jgi:hypothetical protein
MSAASRFTCGEFGLSDLPIMMPPEICPIIPGII